jgi:hypothetical protein
MSNLPDPPVSRLSLDPTTQLPTLAGFDELNQFLAASSGDKESKTLAQGMAGLAAGIDKVLAGIKTEPQVDPAGQAAALMDLMTILREHRRLVIALSAHWRSLYEYPAYLAGLNNFRILISQWLLAASPKVESNPLSPVQEVSLEDFELAAWRTLGDGTLLIDMYEQLLGKEAADSASSALLVSRLTRAKSWWGKLRG